MGKSGRRSSWQKSFMPGKCEKDRKGIRFITIPGEFVKIIWPIKINRLQD